jgi:hypothetical protein
MPTAGRSLELYYIDGQPNGMLTAEMFNWTGHVLMVPRTQLAQALARSEASYAGVYLLLGERDDEALAYIGEGEEISTRIRSHDLNKDWWTSAVVVTTAGNKLNKAHIRYLEARLIEEARNISRISLDNGTAPGRPGLSEADVDKMEVFLENLLIVLPALRIDMFIQRRRPGGPHAGAGAEGEPVALPARFVMRLNRHGLQATAFVQGGEFVVERGSLARLNWEGRETPRSRYGNLHDELKRSGILVPEGERCVFTANYAFTSPSAAAAVVSGRSANGATDWSTPDGVIYREWEAAQVAPPPQEVAG